MTPKDISSEISRTYHYVSESGEDLSYRIEDPQELYIAESGSHRVVDGNGTTHYPASDWIAISWYAPNDPVSF
jgi:hypothetical protein